MFWYFFALLHMKPINDTSAAWKETNLKNILKLKLFSFKTFRRENLIWNSNGIKFIYV